MSGELGVGGGRLVVGGGKWAVGSEQWVVDGGWWEVKKHNRCHCACPQPWVKHVETQRRNPPFALKQSDLSSLCAPLALRANEVKRGNPSLSLAVPLSITQAHARDRHGARESRAPRDDNELRFDTIA